MAVPCLVHSSQFPNVIIMICSVCSTCSTEMSRVISFYNFWHITTIYLPLLLLTAVFEVSDTGSVKLVFGGLGCQESFGSHEPSLRGGESNYFLLNGVYINYNQSKFTKPSSCLCKSNIKKGNVKLSIDNFSCEISVDFDSAIVYGLLAFRLLCLTIFS